MNKLQSIKLGKELTKQEQIVEYLKQDNSYWLKNDIWRIKDKAFQDNDLEISYKTGIKNIKLNYIENFNLKNEIKYYLLYNLKNQYVSLSAITNEYQYAIKYLIEFVVAYCSDKNSFSKIKISNQKWKMFMINKEITINNNNQAYNNTYRNIYNVISNFIQEFYDDREEIEKDIWKAENIQGVKLNATYQRTTSSLSFKKISSYYRTTVKNYFKTIITKKSWLTCDHYLKKIRYFFNYFYSNGYNNGFLENLTRDDIENYLYQINTEFKEHNATYKSKFVSYIRTFLEYIQMAQYDKAPTNEVAFLIFQDDIPKRELNKDEVKKVKFIPEPVIQQLDNNIMDLDRPKYISVYILLRETGWRGTDILNLRYHNCLEKIWNKKEEKYNYNLCGEITKTGIKELKIPIRDEVAEMVEDCIEKAKSNSTENNNPQKYLFNTFEGIRKRKPFSKQPFVNSIRRLIKEKDIRGGDGELYHFTLHQLRHTRAKEYVEQGMGITIIQQILGHTSLQMTVHYAKVSENKLYEKWKDTEDLELFKVNPKTNEVEEINIEMEDRENLIRYEYVKKNLDAVRVPFGVCFKPSKLACKQQLNHCLTCASFCTTTENIPEYEEEIKRVKQQIKTSKLLGRELWAEKNKSYLKLLEEMLEKVKTQKLVHKNAKSREVNSNG